MRFLKSFPLSFEQCLIGLQKTGKMCIRDSVHIKDSMYEDGKLKYTMVGYGDLPVKECIEQLEKAGYEGYYSLEWLKRWDLSLSLIHISYIRMCF